MESQASRSVFPRMIPRKAPPTGSEGPRSHGALPAPRPRPRRVSERFSPSAIFRSEVTNTTAAAARDACCSVSRGANGPAEPLRSGNRDARSFYLTLVVITGCVRLPRVF